MEKSRNIPEIKFDSKKHQYTIDNVVYPSVTQIINSILPPFQVDEWYMNRGVAVHMAAAMIGQGIDFDYDERIEGQVRAIRKFFKEVKPGMLGMFEVLVYSPIYRFSGTLDLIANIGGKRCLVDYKGTMEIERLGLQLAGYSIALEHCLDWKVKYGVGVEIKETGKYKMSPPIKLAKYEREFLALRAVYAIRNRMGYNKQMEEV